MSGSMPALAVALFAVVASHGGAEEPGADPRAEVRAREAAFARTMADRDHAAFVTFLDPEAVFLSPGRVLRGAAEVADGWKELFESAEAPFSWEPRQVEVVESGGLAISTGAVVDPSGEQIGTFVSTWRRAADGEWRVVLDGGCSCDRARSEER